MKVRLDFGPDVDVRVETDGDDNVIGVDITPRFASKSAQAILAYGAASNNQGNVLDRFALVVSGANGKITKKSRTAPVKALVDMTDEERRAAEKEVDGDEESS